MKSIIETAREDDRLSTSVAMLQAGGKAEMLQGGEYTALFPTNEAYSNFSREAMETITADWERFSGMIL